MRKPVAIGYSLVILALFILMLFVEKANGRFWLNDFRVFYMAAEAFINGEAVYGVPFGLDTGFYKYSPFAMMWFIPATLLPYDAAAIVHFLLILISFIALSLICFQWVQKERTLSLPAEIILALGSFLMVFAHMVRELHLGNSNVMLLLMMALSIYFFRKEKIEGGALLFAAAVMLKPYLLACGLAFLIQKKWREILYTAGALFLFTGVTLLVAGFEDGLQLYIDWVKAIGGHSNMLTSKQTFNSILTTYTGLKLSGNMSYFFYLMGAGGSALLFNRWFQRSSDPWQVLGLQVFWLIALVPNAFITDTEHFLFAFPLVVFVLYYLLRNPRRVGIVLFLLFAVGFATMSSDMWGNEGYNRIEAAGMLGIANILLLGWTLYLVQQKSKALSHIS